MVVFTKPFMRRVQLIELHEQAWFPQSIRDEITDILQFGLNLSNAYAPTAPLLQQALRSTRSHVVIDLCSGGGGPWLGLSRKLQGNAQALQICLTDKYPNLKAFETAEAMSGGITFYPESVDATNVPVELRGFRTMFTSFHHFRREEALAILQSSVGAGQGIGIFEITRRSAVTISLMFPWALTPFVFTPFVRPFRWSRLLLTYVIPIIPFVLLFDGVVSCLRTYRPQELSELTDELTGAEYRWETGEHKSAFSKMPITYLMGYPRPSA
jgi:hypothetical protein